MHLLHVYDIRCPLHTHSRCLAARRALLASLAVGPFFVFAATWFHLCHQKMSCYCWPAQAVFIRASLWDVEEERYKVKKSSVCKLAATEITAGVLCKVIICLKLLSWRLKWGHWLTSWPLTNKQLKQNFVNLRRSETSMKMSCVKRTSNWKIS